MRESVLLPAAAFAAIAVAANWEHDAGVVLIVGLAFFAVGVTGAALIQALWADIKRTGK